MYKVLIEKEKGKKTFIEKIKPNVSVGETYFKASLLTEDGDRVECVIGFACKCEFKDFLVDVKKWLEEEVECGQAVIFRKKILEECPDGSYNSIVIDRWYI